MSYTQQAILRDKNGDAIPQIWDVTQNKFVPYTNNDIKLLQNELALVKAELQAIKANQLSGNQKVQLSGTIPVIYISRLEDRPSATEVEIGQFVILTDEELSTWVSNGVNWVEVL